MNRQEGFWLLGSILAILILLLWLVGPEFLNVSETTDINIYDTYFVISNLYASAILIFPLLFFIYGIRCLILRFNKTFPNIIFLISNFILIYLFTRIIASFSKFSGSYNVADNPQVSSGIHEIPENGWDSMVSYLLVINAFLIVLLVITAFMTGRNYNRRQQPL